jgi:hypothetical protein
MQNARNMPPVDVHSSEQNAFVQSWLSDYFAAFPDPEGEDGDNAIALELVIEAVQETYNYKEDPNAKF